MEEKPMAQQANDADLEQVRIQEAAKFIQNEKQLKRIILDARPDMRQLVYERLVPHLTFKPRVFRQLMRH